MKKASKIFAVLLCLVVLCVPLVLPASAGVYESIQYFPETSASNRLSNNSLNIGYYLTSADSDIYNTVINSGLNYESYIKSYGSVFFGNTFMEAGVGDVYNDSYSMFTVASYGAMCISYQVGNQRVYQAYTGIISYSGDAYSTWYLSVGTTTLAINGEEGYITTLSLKIGTDSYIDINDNNTVTVCLFISPHDPMSDTLTYYGIGGAGRYFYLNQAYVESLPSQNISDSYDRGYIDGSKANTTWYDYVFSVVDAPVQVFQQFLGFEIFGVNIAYFIISIFVILFIYVVVKKVK